MALTDITLGQFYPADSVIHKMDARTKILGTLLFLVSLFLIDNIWGFVFAFAFLIACVVISKVPFKFITKGLKPILFILIFTMIINMLSVSGKVLVSFWVFNITEEGIFKAIFMGARLVLLLLGSSLLTLTTKPINLTDGLEKGLGFLKVLKVPVHEISMMMSIALRFIPILVEETDKIMKAQQARGADFESGGLIKKAKNLIPILVPLFVSAFRIAQDLAMAMEARCYRGGNNRTRMNEMKLKKRDAVAFVLEAIFLAVFILDRIYF